MKKNIIFSKCKARAERVIVPVPGFLTDIYYPRLKLFGFSHDNKYKQFLCETFYLNNAYPPIAGLIIGFKPESIKKNAAEVKTILNELQRNYLFFEADDKTFIQCVKFHTGKSCVTSSDAMSVIEDILGNTDSVLVFTGFSRCKMAGDKASLMRSIIKKMEHEKNTSNIIVIDNVEFYQKSKDVLDPYIRYTE